MTPTMTAQIMIITIELTCEPDLAIKYITTLTTKATIVRKTLTRKHIKKR